MRTGQLQHQAKGHPVKGSGVRARMLWGRWGEEKGPAHSLVSSGGGLGGWEETAEAESGYEDTSEAHAQWPKQKRQKTVCLPLPTPCQV